MDQQYQPDGFQGDYTYNEYPQEYQEYQNQEFAQPVKDYDYPQEYQQWPISDPQVIRTKRPGHRKALSISYLNQNPHGHRRTYSQVSTQQQIQSPMPQGHRRVHSFGQELFTPTSPMTPPPMNPYQPYGHQKSMSNVSLNMSMGNMNMGQELFQMEGKKRLLHSNFEENMYQEYPTRMMQPPVFYDDSKDGITSLLDEQVITTCSWGPCQLYFATQELLVQHILNEHVGTGRASYVCEWRGCSRQQKPFSKRHKIQNHIRIHTGERPFPCPVADCGKKFSRQDGLNTHIKPYICSFPNCGKAYFHSRSLRKHERTHYEQPSESSNNVPDWGMLQQMAMTTMPGQMQGQMSGGQLPGQMNEQGYLMELASITQKPEQNEIQHFVMNQEYM